MNTDQVKGKANQVVGKMKQSAGEVTGNDQLANQGVIDQAKGAAQETWGNVKDAAEEAAHSQATDRQHKRSEMRDNIAHKVEDAKKGATEAIDRFREQERKRRPA